MVSKSAVWLQLMLTEAEGSGVEDSVNAKLLSAGLARFVEPRRNKVRVFSKKEYLLSVTESSDTANACTTAKLFFCDIDRTMRPQQLSRRLSRRLESSTLGCGCTEIQVRETWPTINTL